MTLVSIAVIMRIDRATPGTTVKRKRGARRLLERAGFSRVRFGGVRRGLARGMRGRYVVLASSGSLPCERTVRFHLGAG